MKREDIIKELEKRKNQLILEFEKNISSINNTIQILKIDTYHENDLIEKLSKQQVIFEDKIDYLNVKAKTIPETILNIIRSQDRFLHNSEITDIMSKIYIGKDKNKLSRQISGQLSQLKKDNKIASFSNGFSKKQIYWGFNKWLKDDKIIEGHEYFKI